MAEEPAAEEQKGIETPTSQFARWLTMIVFLLLVTSYIVAVVSGRITHKLDAVDLALIALAGLVAIALVHPKALTQIKIFELGSIKVELREIKDVQSEHQSGLDELRLVLSILLPDYEQAHLLNLLTGATSHYSGGYAMRTELRHLRALGLIGMRNNHRVEEMRSTMVFDLKDYVRLTDLGAKAAHMIREAREARQHKEESPE